WIEMQLAHVDKNSIRGTYNHAQYIENRKIMLQWYSDFLLTTAII
ncbi:integrase, partial [Escherichia coli]|nr:integrase [Escherichia coli]